MRPPSPALRPLRPLLDLETVCWRCTCRLTRLRRYNQQQQQQQYVAATATATATRSFSKTAGESAPLPSAAPSSKQRPLREGYFLGNHVFPQFGANRGLGLGLDLGARVRKLTRGAGVSSAPAQTALEPKPGTAAALGIGMSSVGASIRGGAFGMDAAAGLKEQVEAGRTSTTRDLNELPAHRRRWAAKHVAASIDPSPTSPTPPLTPKPSTTSGPDPPALAPLPLDASAMLAQVAARHPANSARRTLSALLSLAKPRLTVLVVLTAMAPYALYPVPSFVAAGAGGVPSLSPITLCFLTVGTTLCSAAANALNMAYEPDTDSRMSRTRARPLVRSLLSTRAAVLFAAACALAGVVALYFGVNPTVSFLGAANIVLYAGIYTPLKRVSAANTWVGAVVGAVPPLMGWAAAAGESATGQGGWRELLLPGVHLFSSGAHQQQQPVLLQLDEDPTSSSSSSSSSSAPGSKKRSPTAAASLWGGWLLAALLFGWQFPHFMALSWPVRDEYRAAGLRMLAWTNPARNARVALRYSLAMVPVCLGLCAAGVVEWSFAATSLPANAWLAREAWRFWKAEGGRTGKGESVRGGGAATAATTTTTTTTTSTSKGNGGNMSAKISASSARGLFWASVWYLPVVMVLALVQKKGMWGRVWRSVFGEEDDGEDEWEEYDDEGEPARTGLVISSRTEGGR